MEKKADEKKNSKSTAVAYIVLRVLVIAVMVREIVRGQWGGAIYCVLTLVLFMIPSVVERRLKIELPSALEIVVLLFIFAAEILGEIGAFYIKVPGWDLILHAVNGFLMAAIGFTLIDVLNQIPEINMSLSPFFVAFVAFCFSMTIGVLWEFAEYGADKFLGADMQKDTIVSTIGSVVLNEDGTNKVVLVTDIEKTVISGKICGEECGTVVDGYLDIGLHDTMEDMLVNLIGALIFSVIGAIYLKGRGVGKGKIAGAFIPRMLTEQESEELAERQAQKRREKRERLKDSQPYDI